MDSISDERLKTNIQPIEGALDRVLRLQGRTFEFKEPEKIGALPGQQTGMIAQEVEKAFPEWVDEGADGYKYLTYRGFEAMTVEAFRELRAEKDAEITALKERNSRLESRLADLEKAVRMLGDQKETASR